MCVVDLNWNKQWRLLESGTFWYLIFVVACVFAKA
jgi:hypothetical protein